MTKFAPSERPVTRSLLQPIHPSPHNSIGGTLGWSISGPAASEASFSAGQAALQQRSTLRRKQTQDRKSAARFDRATKKRVVKSAKGKGKGRGKSVDEEGGVGEGGEGAFREAVLAAQENVDEFARNML